MLKAVIFDMDGVIIDSEPYHYEAETIIFEKLGIKVPNTERNQFVGLSNRKICEYLIKSYNLSKTTEDLLDITNKMRLEYFLGIDSFKPIPGIPELLNDLRKRGIKLAIASSSSIDIIDLFMKKLHLGHYFLKVISGDFVKNGKPDPDIYVYTAELLNESEKDCLVIEDSQNGIQAAKSAHMKCIAFQNTNTTGQNLVSADLVIKNFREIDYQIIASIVN